MLVTPPDFPGRSASRKGRTTSQFLTSLDCRRRSTADNFGPFDGHDIWSYWPYAFEPKWLMGAAASDGVQYGEPDMVRPVLLVSSDNHATISPRPPPRPWYTGIAGIDRFIVDGKPLLRARAPQTSVALDQSGTVLFLVVVDWDQPPYSSEIDTATMTSLLMRLGAFNAMRLDNGGTSTLVVADWSYGLAW